MALEAPAAEQFYRAPAWVKPRVDPDVQATVRQLLDISEDDDLPQDFLHYLAFFAAKDPDFNDKIAGLSGRWMLLVFVLQYESFIKPFKEKAWIKPGSKVTIKSQNREAIYVSGGPGKTDLVNCGGLFQIVKCSDIEADALSVKDSEENELIGHGKIRKGAMAATSAAKAEIQALIPKV